ncbi:TOBE domain-containing protein, partial [Vibrio parahaemolyticus]|uniref:TOBE domain-containing protein n=1 Tax=Vibrio parahaemolyticus TaxID=670 RepID=UPI001C4F709C
HEALSMADRIVVMNHGVIEQVGTPQEIYQQPATRFVAEFVGSMNFIETSVVTESQVRIAETLLPAPSLTNRKIQRGDRFDLAVRPENIKFVENYRNSLPVRITATEFLGAFFRVDCELQNDSQAKPIVVDVPVETVQNLNIRIGDVRYIQFLESGLHGYVIPSQGNAFTKALAA